MVKTLGITIFPSRKGIKSWLPRFHHPSRFSGINLRTELKFEKSPRSISRPRRTKAYEKPEVGVNVAGYYQYFRRHPICVLDAPHPV